MKQSGDVMEGLRGLAVSNTGQREMVGAGEAVGGDTWSNWSSGEFSRFEEEMSFQVYKAQLVLRRLNKNKSPQRLIVMKVENVKGKRKNLESNQDKKEDCCKDLDSSHQSNGWKTEERPSQHRGNRHPGTLCLPRCQSGRGWSQHISGPMASHALTPPRQPGGPHFRRRWSPGDSRMQEASESRHLQTCHIPKSASAVRISKNSHSREGLTREEEYWESKGDTGND